MNESHGNLLGTARVVFLSKTKSEIAKDHKSYRCLAVQPTFIRILEDIVYRKLNHKLIRLCQFKNQAGFTKDMSIQTHIERLWNLIEKARLDQLQLSIASIDIRGAYDGVSHQFLFDKLKRWKRKST